MNAVQTNTFIKGLNLDIDISAISNEQYRYAENVRVLTDDNGTSGVLQNINDINNIPSNIEIPSDEKIMAVTVINQYAAIITVDSSNTTRIYKLEDYDTDTIKLSVVLKGKLGNTKEDSIKIVGNYESENNIKIYFVDGINPLRSINIMDNTYSPDSGNINVDQNGNIKDPDILNATPGAILTPPSFIGMGEGNLKAGMVQYCYQLFNERGSSTIMSPCCSLIHLTTSNTTENSKYYVGTEKDTYTGKSVRLKIQLDTSSAGIKYTQLYDGCKIYQIFYNDNTEDPTVNLISEMAIKGSSGIMEFEDTGSSIISTMTLNEFNAINNYTFIPATIEKKNNRLFAANVKQREWTLNYDARAYRCDSNGKLILEHSDSSQNIEQQLPERGTQEELDFYMSIPETHDCINPYNSFTEGDVSSCDYQYSNVKIGGKRILGGSGLNVSYRFIYNKINLGSTGNLGNPNTVDRNSDALDLSISSVSTNELVFYYLDNNQYQVKESIPVSMPINPNYADPYIAYRTTGYQRDEIYRFGIVFYNKQGLQSDVKWIGDIRMPHPSTYSAFWSNSSLEGDCLGIEFTIQNIPQEAIAYDIVRCERTMSDRTVVMQGVLSNIFSYGKQYVSGDYVSGDADIRPMAPLQFGNQDITYIYRSGRQTDKYDSSKLIKDMCVMISPEVDAMQDNAVQYLNGVYIEPIYWLHTCAFRSSDNGTNLTMFSVPTTINRGYTTEIINASEYLGTVNSYSDLISGGRVKGVVFGDESNGSSVHSVTNLVSRRFILNQRDDTNTRKYYQISNDTIYPPLMAKDAITNKMPYYRSINGKSYLSLGMNANYSDTDNNGAGRSGYFGSHVVLSGSSISNITRNSNNIYGTFRASDYIKDRINVQQVGISYYDIPVVNIKKKIIPYGGNSYFSRSNSTYISTNTYTKVKSNQSSVCAFGGDTYLGILDHRTCTPWPNVNTGGSNESMQLSCYDYIPFETSINLNLTYGDCASRTGSTSYVNPWFGTNIDQGNSGSYYAQTKPYFAYNDAYSVQSSAKLFAPKGVYDIDDQTISNRILYSQLKTNNEVSDNWLQFKVADYLDVDNKYGKITNMLSFRDRLFFWQDNALGIAAVNERSLITDNNINTLTLGTGGILTRYDYITTGNGSSVVNDKGIVTSDFCIYWFDKNKNEICSYSDNIHKLSKEKSVQTFLNSNKGQNIITSIYCPKFNEIQLCFDKGNIVYNEVLQSFTSFYTYKPDNSLLFTDKLIYIKDNKFSEEENKTLKNIQSKITYIVNKDTLQTKTFDNVFFGGVFYNIKDMLKNVVFTTKSQEGTILEDSIDGGYAIDYREDTYRFAIGREKNSSDELSLPGRLKGKYLICDYTIDCSGQKYFNLPNINTTYRYSLV